jgi:hypothetical protein
MGFGELSLVRSGVEEEILVEFRGEIAVNMVEEC